MTISRPWSGNWKHIPTDLQSPASVNWMRAPPKLCASNPDPPKSWITESRLLQIFLLLLNTKGKFENSIDIHQKKFIQKLRKKLKLFLPRSRRLINTADAAVSCNVMATLRTNLNLVSYPARWSFPFILGPLHWSSIFPTSREHRNIVQLCTNLNHYELEV